MEHVIDGGGSTIKLCPAVADTRGRERKLEVASLSLRAWVEVEVALRPGRSRDCPRRLLDVSPFPHRLLPICYRPAQCTSWPCLTVVHRLRTHGSLLHPPDRQLPFPFRIANHLL